MPPPGASGERPRLDTPGSIGATALHLASVKDEVRYWDRIAADWAREPRSRSQRRYSDLVTQGLLRRWLPAGGFCRCLKTDLFDEVVSDGVQPLLAKAAKVAVGMDLSGDIVRLARDRSDSAAAKVGLQAAVQADVRHLPFADGSLDLVLSNSTLDHFASQYEIELSLRELARVLRPAGTLIVTLDNPVHPLLALRALVSDHLWQRTGLVPYQTGVTLGPRALRRALQAAGFHPRELTAAMHFPRVLIELADRICQRIGLRQGASSLAAAAMRFEALERLPTRFVTGHFVAACAVRG